MTAHSITITGGESSRATCREDGCEWTLDLSRPVADTELDELATHQGITR